MKNLHKNNKKTGDPADRCEASDYLAIFNAANDAIFVNDIEAFSIVDANEKACQMFCYPKKKLLQLAVKDLVLKEAPYTYSEVTAFMKKAVDGEPQLFEWVVSDSAGRPFWVEVNLKRAVIGGKYRLLAIVRDINDRKEAEAALRKSEKRYSILVNNLPLHMAFVDMSGKFTVWNKYSEGMLGYTAKEAIGKLSQSEIHKSKAEAKEVLRIATSKGIFDDEVELRHKSGKIVYAHLVAVPLKDASGKIIEFCGFAENITKSKKAEEELVLLNKELKKTNENLKQLAVKDPLTGLYNHRYLNEAVETEFYRVERYSHPLSVILLDIDYFKSVNEVYGHNFGDTVLKQFSELLKRMVRRYDIVIRYGGEEFAVLLSNVDRSKALVLAQRLVDAINLYNFGDKEHVVKIKLTAAISSYPEDGMKKGADLINFADKILNKAKEAGGNRVYSLLDIKKKSKAPGSGGAPADVKFLTDRIEKLTKGGKRSLIESITAFAKTIELRDHYTGEHVESTVRYATDIAKALNLPAEDIEKIRQAAVLHDLGKIGISDKILLKKSKLTRKELDEIKKHPQIAADIIRPIQFMHDIIPLVLYHHERWDAKGYPAGLRGEDIPIGARIIAIADVYQALISNRPYRKAFSKKKALELIKKGSGTQFDPMIVNTFLKTLKKEKK